MQQFIEFSIRHWELWLAFLVVLCLLLGFEMRSRFTGFPQLSAQATTLLINRENALVLDIRDSSSFNKGHIIGSINIPLAELEDKVKSLEKHKKRTVVIIYSVGQSTTKVANLLQNKGFADINTLKGGITTWQNAGLPLIKD